ncbi:alpha/beta hydrolase family esterase [Streptosporangium sp. NPDC000396]|uniref:extracellular catalytic domain type 1 short-chain-length polyhydroxyalkanoate depolymerase n=1 Tax=Streptosporangium sp. NPDC000396 TaxID=3366185 RepID=UPI0036945D23
MRVIRTSAAVALAVSAVAYAVGGGTAAYAERNGAPASAASAASTAGGGVAASTVGGVAANAVSTAGGGVAVAGGRTSVHTIIVDGLERRYRVHRPASLPAKAPLVVMMHGGFGSARQAEESYGWNAEADRRHFVVAYPEGYGRAWNVGDGCCGKPGRRQVDDVAFISRMVARIGRELRIDPRQVYATGMSNGGMMAYRLACDTTIFAAIGPVATTRLGDCPGPEPVSIVHIHGLADQTVRFDGAPGTGAARIDGPPVPEVIAGWRRVDRCGRPAVSRSGPVTTELAGCRGGRAVRLTTIDGAGHQWPGGEVVREQADPPSRDLDATAVIWDFFVTHPKS